MKKKRDLSEKLQKSDEFIQAGSKYKYKEYRASTDKNYLKRYSDLISFYKNIKINYADYKFYKIKNKSEFIKAMEIDKTIHLEKKNKLTFRTYYGGFIWIKGKKTGFERIYKKDPLNKIISKIKTKHIPLFQKEKKIYKIINKKLFKSLILNLKKRITVSYKELENL